MFVLVVLVPGLMVVVLGYAAGYAAIEWLDGLVAADLPAAAPEVGGWLTGLALLVAVAGLLVVRPPWLRRLVARVWAWGARPGPGGHGPAGSRGGRGHQK